jgi:dihydrodipicolinate synthase/N-acetylneuraminate lyase
MNLRPPRELAGIIPVIPTPFTLDERLDLVALRRLVRFAIKTGAEAVCLPAYASEFYKLDRGEREAVIAEAVEEAGDEIPVIAQVNCVSVRHSIEAAKVLVGFGASFISTAVPRQFAVGEADLFRYFSRLLESLEVPLIIQDFNPGGPTISARLIADLHKAHPQFRYVKLEDPLRAGKIKSILDLTQGRVGVIDGWGGLYMLELIEAGICAVMPGLAVSDILRQVWRLARAKRAEEAYDVFQGVLPQIVHSLQNLEFFHQAEKRLLVARGLLEQPVVRELCLELSQHDVNYLEFLNGRILALLNRLSIPINPITIPNPK